MDKERQFNFGWAWIALCLALAFHVTDKALANFLSVYNPTVMAVRQRLPLLPSRLSLSKSG
jgi:hypothetical protein